MKYKTLLENLKKWQIEDQKMCEFIYKTNTKVQATCQKLGHVPQIYM